MSVFSVYIMWNYAMRNSCADTLIFLFIDQTPVFQIISISSIYEKFKYYIFIYKSLNITSQSLLSILCVKLKF